MARKAEVGIDYFPLNTDIFEHKKIKLTVADNGIGSLDVFIRLLCKIYKEKGYWFDWMDEDGKIMLAEESKHSITFVNSVVDSLVRREFFCPSLFSKYGILTSDRIQDNYFIAKKRVKSFVVIRQFLLLSNNVVKTYENVDIMDLTANIIFKNVNIGTQNKIIEGEGKGEEEGDGAQSTKFTLDERKIFSQTIEWIDKHAPRVNKMKEPFTIEEVLKLGKKLDKQSIKDLLIAMHNNKPLLQKNISAYLTILNWAKRSNPEPVTSSVIPGGPSLSETVKLFEQS